jgi:hypothetical protein
MRRIRSKLGNANRRGAALLYATIIAVAMAGLCVALLGMTGSTGRVRVQAQTAQRSFYAAEAGLSDAFMRMTEGQLELADDGPTYVGTSDAPVPLGTSSYWVEINEINSRSYSLASTGSDGLIRERLELIISEAPTGFFQYAAFGDKGVVLDSNAFVDSYDSSVGTYDSQVQSGNEFAKENGTVGSNADILLKSNTQVHGDAIPGPDHIVDDSASNVYVSGSTDPAEEPFELPPIDVPDIASSGSIVGTTDVVLGPGDIHYSSILMKGGTKLRIQGPAKLVVDAFQMKSNTNLIFDAANGPIELYATANFVLESNSKVTTLSNTALDVTLLLAGNNMTKKPADLIQLGANSDFIGAIYAPNAKFKLASNFDIYGSIMCGYLDLSSFGEIHFDEALLYDGWGSTDDYEPALWHRIALE